MLTKVWKKNQYIEDKGVKIVLVHQLSICEANHHFEKYNLQNVSSISDPELILYKGFYLQRGKLSQIFGWKDMKRLFSRGNLLKHGISSFKDEDPFQMPGVFMVKNGEIVQKFVHTSVSDKVPFKELTSETTI